MAHEIAVSTTGQASFAFAGEPAWHGLGQRLEPGDSLDQVAAKAGLAWTAERLPKYGLGPSGALVALPGYALVRSDLLDTPNASALGEVGPDYKVVQPAEILAAMQELATQLGATLETAGALRGGQRIFGLVRFPDDLVLGREDRVARYATVYTSFDGTLATCLAQTSIRVVCANTLRASIAQERSLADRGLIRFTHAQVSQLTAARVGHLADQWVDFARWAERAADTSITPADAADFAHALATRAIRGGELSLVASRIDAGETQELGVLGQTWPKRGQVDGVDAEVLAAAREQARIVELREDLLRALDISPGAAMESARGSLWGSINAASYVLGRGKHIARQTAASKEGLTAERLGIGAPKWEAALASLVDEVLSRPATGVSLDALGIALETRDGDFRAGVLSA